MGFYLEPRDMEETEVYMVGGDGGRKGLLPPPPLRVSSTSMNRHINIHQFICIAAGRGKLTCP